MGITQASPSAGGPLLPELTILGISPTTFAFMFMLSLPFRRLQGQGCALRLRVQLLCGSTRAGRWGGSPSTRGGSRSSWGPDELGRALPELGLMHQERLCLAVPGRTPGMGVLVAGVRGLRFPAAALPGGTDPWP